MVDCNSNAVSRDLIRSSSALGHSRPGRADSRFGHVGFPLIAIESCGAAEFRDVPQQDHGRTRGDAVARSSGFHEGSVLTASGQAWQGNERGRQIRAGGSSQVDVIDVQARW